MSVYFITCREANAVKIGSSGDPRIRLREVQWGCPLEVTLEAVIPGSHDEEFALHRRFADDRLRGEWFTITQTIGDMISANRVASVGPEEITLVPTAIGDAPAKFGLTRPALAERLGITLGEMSRYEGGRKLTPELEQKLERIARRAARRLNKRRAA